MLKYINENTNTQEEYGYACARIRELEKKLLKQETLGKIIDTNNYEEALKILNESTHGEYAFENADILSIEGHLEEILKKTIYLIKEISPYPFLYQLFSCKYDFHNLKVLLKSKFIKKEDSFPIYNIGNISIDNLKSAVFDEKYKSIPMIVERFIKEAEEEYNKNEDLQLMEILLDQGYYEIIFNKLKDVNQPFLFYYYKTEIDLLNFIIACRCKIRYIKKSELSKILIKYGNYSIQKIIDIYENSINSWPNYFQKTDYSAIVENGIKQWHDEKSLLELERLSDNYLINLLKIGKYTTFGLESIIAYFYAKENDIKNIRIILYGKKNSLPKDIIKKKIRDAYV